MNHSTKLTSRQTFTNNGRFNSALSSNQYRINSNVDRRNHSNTRIHLGQTTKNRSLSSIKTINHRSINQDHHIRIDLRAASNSHTNSNNLITPSTTAEQRQSILFNSSENVPKLTRECDICLLDQPLNLFKERYSNECEHIERRICDTCVYNHIKIHVENILNNNIICPESNCLTRFSFENIRYILNMENNYELFERYDRQLTHKYLEQNEEFIWCAHNGCGSGQFHDMSLYKNPMFICIKCKKQTCAYHRIIWHSGMNCQEYDQSKFDSIDNNTQIWLNKHSKKCPKCKSYIEKISGCDHMICQKCKHQFCWQCFSDYKKIQIYGLRLHKKTCSHHPQYNHTSHTQISAICNIL